MLSVMLISVIAVVSCTVNYNVCVKVRSPGGSDTKVRVFDAQHERRRKEQLEKLFHRTEEQVSLYFLFAKIFLV